MSSIVQRLSDFIKHKGISIRKFEIAVGMSNGAMGKAIKNDSDLYMKYLDKIFVQYPDINPYWLLKGEGEMLVGENYVNEPLANYYTPAELKRRLLEILTSPSKTEEEQILKQEVLRLQQSIEEIRDLHEKKLIEVLNNIAGKQD